MRKLLWLIVCLMTMVVSVNAQDDIYYTSTSKTNSHTSWFDKVPSYGIGAGVYNRTNEKSNIGWSIEVICGGFLIAFTDADTSNESKGDYSFVTDFQFGYFIPIKKFDKEEWSAGCNKSLLISPLISIATKQHVEGEYLHSGETRISGHNCQYWVDESYSEGQGVGFGVALMYRHNCGYAMCKVTTHGVSATFGVSL